MRNHVELNVASTKITCRVVGNTSLRTIIPILQSPSTKTSDIYNCSDVTSQEQTSSLKAAAVEHLRNKRQANRCRCINPLYTALHSQLQRPVRSTDKAPIILFSKVTPTHFQRDSASLGVPSSPSTGWRNTRKTLKNNERPIYGRGCKSLFSIKQLVLLSYVTRLKVLELIHIVSDF